MMNKDEIVSAIVRLARAENLKVCFFRDGRQAIQTLHRGNFSTLDEKAQAAIERHAAARTSYMLCARTARKAVSLGELENYIRDYCGAACTVWAMADDRSPRNLDYIDAELFARREALRIVVLENLRAHAAAKKLEVA